MGRRRSTAFLVLTFALVSSCGTGDDGARTGVGVRSINTNIGLGIEIEQIAPPNTIVQQPRQLEVPEETIPPFEFEIPKPVNRPCPEAGPFDFPAIETGVDPVGRPKAGTYDWKVDGTYTTGTGVFKIDVFVKRTIRNVRDFDQVPGSFTYEEVQEEIVEGQQRQTVTTLYRVTPESPINQEQVPSDAGRGLFLERYTVNAKDAQGRDIETTFDPVNAIQLLAFPVKDGATVESSGTDPNGLAELSIRGVVKGHKQVDACGERVDSWFVDAEQIFRYTDGRNGQTQSIRSNFDYAVAPQYGSQFVFVHQEVPVDAPALVIDARIGRVPERTGG